MGPPSAAEWLVGLTIIAVLELLYQPFGWAIMGLGFIIGVRREPFWVMVLTVAVVSVVTWLTLSAVPLARGFGRNTAFLFTPASVIACTVSVFVGRISAAILGRFR